MAIHTCFDPDGQGRILHGMALKESAQRSVAKTRVRHMIVRQALKRKQRGWSGIIYRRDPKGDLNPGMR